jgi:hypothetical protein
MKLKMVNLHNTNNVPDHIIEETEKTCQKMIKNLGPILNSTNPNIFLSAMNWIHASLILTLVTEEPEEIKKAAKNCSIGLIKNIEKITGINIFDEN